MKKFILAVLLVILVQGLFTSAAGAQYLKQYDKKISINTGQNLNLPINTGGLTFILQEAVHNQLTTTTGLEIDHYYLWLELDGKQVIGVDPIRPMF